MGPLDILIVDDHRLFRQGLRSLMSVEPELVNVIGEADNGQDAIKVVGALRPDLVLMDIDLPDISGFDATRRIQKLYPNVAVLILTASDTIADFQEALKLGVAGYLLKDLDAHELFELLRAIQQGERAITKSMANRMFTTITNEDQSEFVCEDLTSRELDVLRLLAQGYSNRQIADNLYISVNTAKVHVRNILEKLCVDNRSQAAVMALNTGILE